MASKNRAEHLSAEHIRLKKYFYVMRSLLAARWVAELQTALPVPFAKLVDAQLDPAMKPLFNELIQRKVNISESDLMPRVAELDV